MRNGYRFIEVVCLFNSCAVLRVLRTFWAFSNLILDDKNKLTCILKKDFDGLLHFTKIKNGANEETLTLDLFLGKEAL